jgi:hypothetical protein
MCDISNGIEAVDHIAITPEEMMDLARQLMKYQDVGRALGANGPLAHSMATLTQEIF